MGSEMCIRDRYSGGEEGTLVLWHLRENTKDFIPRLGSSIMNISVQDGEQGTEIICFLSDNTVKIIYLNEDKKVVQFKLIVNPFALKTVDTLRENRDKNFDVFVNVNEVRETVCLSSVSGRLQFLHLRTGSNYEYNVISRNIISRLDNDYPNPHKIVKTVFNKNWTVMVCVIQGVNHSSLNFYQAKGDKDWQPVSKILNPHEG